MLWGWHNFLPSVGDQATSGDFRPHTVGHVTLPYNLKPNTVCTSN